ncbi:helix-turn-helix domain-containing protein [Anaerosacchariphilus polymeriproducens]|uniref:DNA-binding protein n=1 Tax=Anaerosacchariphilus polymeriproducens TaxID=1812858 RepID=A0A371AUI1_9FIRM|nr:helix-turn-helix domain-containing protein [Anaerosacchariphilus polymeriproducens]RDU23218.1 DNA-binding protein [Anaerosacchariphilus polymeriproducens]
MEREFYTVDQIAKMLNIHPKTIQRYIREGKLRATKIGKSWRVSGHDLSCFTENNVSVYSMNSEDLIENRVRASSVIDITVINKEEANRISNSLTAAMNVKPVEYGQASLHAQFLEMDKVLRITLWGNANFMSAIFSFIEVFVNQTKEDLL